MFVTFNIKRLLLSLVFCVFIISLLVISVFAPLPGGVSETSVKALGARTLIIDAGHGGEDGGCTSITGKLESDINLDIAVRMQSLAGLFGIEPVMTRESAEISYPESAKTISAKKVYDQKTRVELINTTPNAILISIHQNTYPDARPRGPQAFFAKTSGSAELAAIVHENLKSALYPESRRVAAPISDSVYLMKKVECPAVLVECGFISNADDDALIADGGYRIKLASIMLSSYLQFLAEGEDMNPSVGTVASY